MSYLERQKIVQNARQTGGVSTYLSPSQRLAHQKAAKEQAWQQEQNQKAQKVAEQQAQELWNYATDYSISRGPEIEGFPKYDVHFTNPIAVEGTTSKYMSPKTRFVTQEQYDAITKARDEIMDYYKGQTYSELQVEKYQPEYNIVDLLIGQKPVEQKGKKTNTGNTWDEKLASDQRLTATEAAQQYAGNTAVNRFDLTRLFTDLPHDIYKVDGQTFNNGVALQNYGDAKKLQAMTYGVMLQGDFTPVSEKSANTKLYDDSRESLIHNIVNGFETVKSNDSLYYKYTQLDDAQKSVYNYLFEKDKKQAKDYLDLINDDIATKAATAYAEELDSKGFIGDVARGAKLVETNLTQGALDMSFAPAMLPNNKVDSRLQEMAFKTTDNERLSQAIIAGEDNEATKLIFEAISSVSRQAIPLIVGSVGGSATYSFGLGFQVTAQSIKEAALSNKPIESGLVYGLIQTGFELALERLFHGVGSKVAGGSSSKIVAKLFSKINDKVTNKLLSKVLKGAISSTEASLGEFMQEFSQAVIDPMIRNVVYYENNTYTWETLCDAFRQGLIGFLSGGIMAAPYTSASVTATELEMVGANSNPKTVLSLAEKAGLTKTDDYVQVKKAVENGSQVDILTLGRLSVEATRTIYSNENFTKAYMQAVATEGSVSQIAELMFDNNVPAAKMFKDEFGGDSVSPMGNKVTPIDAVNTAEEETSTLYQPALRSSPTRASKYVTEYVPTAQPETTSTEAAPTQTEAEQAAPKRAGISNLSARNKSKDVLSRAVDGVIGVEDLTEDQKTLKKIGEQFGAKVEFANLDKYFINENGERVLDSPNGRFDPNTNTITLNTSNKVKHDPVEFILKHEMTHSFEINKEAYAIFAKEVLRSNVFKDYVKNQKGFASVDAWSKDIIDRYDKAGHPLGENATEKALGARKEMIADFVGDMLFGKQNEIAEELINAMSPTARRSFIEWVTDFLTEIKQAFLGKPEYTTIEQIEKDFLKLARKVEKQNSKAEQSDSNRSQNAAKNEKTTTEEGDGKKYDSAKDKKLYDYIKDAIAGKLPKKSFYKISDKISEKLARDIEKIVGFSVEEFGNEISPDSILHINNEHGANGTKDQSMQDYNDLAKISYVLDNYTKIKKGKKSNKYRNSDGTFAQTVVLQAKVNNEFYYVVEAVPYAKTKSLRVVSAFKNKKDTFPDELVSNDPKRYVQDENQSNVSNNSLPKTTSVVKENVEKVNVEIDEKTESASPLSYSLTSWEQSDYVDNRNTAAKELADALGITQKKAKDYIDSINSIAKVIADDRTRLDYVAAKGRSTFVSNAEYGGSVDCSTLCPKRKILTGTFSAIQKALKNSALTAEEILDIRNRMKEKGLEVSCGLCYVEGSRAQMGKFSKEFIERYKKTNPEYVPDMFDVNTPEGVEQLRIDHPEVYEAYEKFWNNKGVLNEGDSVLFASQQKPKLYQTRTDYKGEILNKFKSEGNVVEKNKNGGLRLQSFSDFEIVHLIDMMQVVMDMSRVGLAGQAYTKVPDFALALGNTGLKINLSLIAKGVDENGNLIFDDVEGMPIDTAMRIRDMYSDNVGTILVVFNDAQLKAALADNRVDFIIPFHRSQWKKALYEKLGLPKGTKDYTYQQNEKYIKPVYYTTRNGTIGTRRATNYMPNEYWDFGKSGKENAEAYLKMCAENNKRPKFYKLLVDNKDGSYSLQPDGSTDGYWKLLIDFKMYNNDGVGVPQQPVKPDFNMEESLRMLEEYKGGHQQFPVDQETVDNFVKDYKAKHKMDDFVENESTEAKAPDNPYKGFSYSLPESVDTDSVIEALTRGEITEEEAKQMLKRGKIKNPIEIANTPKEAANTTPKLKEPKMKGEGDGESNLYDTLLESDIVTDEVKAQVENNTYIKNYGTTTNKATLKEALDRLDTYGLKEVRRFENLQPQHASAVDIAVGIILLQRYQDIGDTSGAIVIAEKLSSIASNAGRAVQIFSILSRFTPETMVAYAQHELDKAFDIMQKKQTKKWIEANKKKFQLTKEDIDIITQNTLYASDLQDGSHTKAILLGEITTLLQDKLPPEKGQALRAWMRISLLFNVKTNLRNFLGNASMASIYVGSDFFGSFVDKAISKKTGIRTTGVDPKILGTSIVKGGAKGVAETYDDFKRRIHTKQQELNRFQDNAIAGKSFNEQTQYEAINKIAKTLNEVDRITSMLLELGDRPFFEMWFMNSLETQKKLNKVSEPTPQMVEAAKLEALQRTWQDDNMVTKAVGQLKQALNNLTPGFGHTGYGLGDIALKFTKTPANIAKAMFELSPLGFGVAAADLVNMKRAMDKGEFTPAMQKRLTRSFGNAMIGTLIYLAVYGLAASGAIDFGGDGDDDKDVSNFEKYVLGVPPYSFKFLGHDITYTWNQPIGTVLAIVADIMDGAEEGDLSAWDVVSTAGQVFTSQSFLTNLYELFSKDDVLTGIISVVLSEPSAMVPTLFSQLASSLDPYRRTTYSDNLLQSTLNDILYRIPGLRMTLPKQVNVLGEESKNPQFANILKAFVDPSTQYPKASAETMDVATEVYALYEATSDKTVIPRVAPKSVTVKGKTVKFTTEEKNAFQKRTGELSVELLRELFALPEYQELTEEEKIDAVTSIYDYVNDKAKSELDIYDYEVLAEMEGKNNQGQYILKEETYNRLTDKAKQIIVDDYFFSSDVIKCKGDSKKLAKLFAKKSKK